MFTLDPYAVKAVEYLTGIAFLLLFVKFWSYVNGEPAPAARKAWSGQLSEWFRIPERLLFHPAHTWARFDNANVATVGMDDFAQQLVGPLQRVELPQPGTLLHAGERAWTLHADGKAVEMLSPVDGKVVALNYAVAGHAETVNDDPYGKGWLMRIQVPSRRAAIKDLMTGAAARRWIERVSADLTASMTPELGHLCQDGGLPVHGIARGMDPDHWDEVAKRFLQPSLLPPDDKRVGRTIFMVLFAIALSGWAATVIAQTLPNLPGALEMAQSKDSPGKVTFNHETHVDADKPACTNCHPREFRMLKTTTRAPITHDDMGKGRHCGSCHDGTKAFGMDDCTFCHQQ